MKLIPQILVRDNVKLIPKILVRAKTLNLVMSRWIFLFMSYASAVFAPEAAFTLEARTRRVWVLSGHTAQHCQLLARAEPIPLYQEICQVTYKFLRRCNFSIIHVKVFPGNLHSANFFHFSQNLSMKAPSCYYLFHFIASSFSFLSY
jgi:hypothetical protein